MNGEEGEGAGVLVDGIELGEGISGVAFGDSRGAEVRLQIKGEGALY